MKQGIHPKYGVTKYSCACGATFDINSTLGEEMKIEICSKCHPLYTGKERLVDTEGRIDKFKNKYKNFSVKK